MNTAFSPPPNVPIDVVFPLSPSSAISFATETSPLRRHVVFSAPSTFPTYSLTAPTKFIISSFLKVKYAPLLSEPEVTS